MLIGQYALKDFAQAKSTANTGSAYTIVTAWTVPAEQLPGEIYTHVSGHLDQHRGFFTWKQ